MLVKSEIEINAPRDKVFVWVDDEHHVKQWMDELISVQHLNPVGRHNPVGARMKHKIKENGKIKSYDAEVIAYEPGKALGLRLWTKAFSVEVFYRFSDSDHGTLMKYESKVKFNKLLMKWMGALSGPMVSRKLKGQFAKLKALAEQENAGV